MGWGFLGVGGRVGGAGRERGGRAAAGSCSRLGGRSSFSTLTTAFVMLSSVCQRHTVVAVDRTKFRTCGDTGFCKQYRDKDPLALPRFRLGSYSKVDVQGFVGATLHPYEEDAAKGAKDLDVIFRLYQDGSARVTVKETGPVRDRWQPTDILMEHEMKPARFQVVKSEENGTIALQYADDKTLLITKAPFSVDLLVGGEPVVGFNKRGLLHMERYREKKAKKELGAGGEQAEAAGGGEEGDGEDRHKGKKVVGYWEDGLAIYEDGTREEKPSAEEEAAKQRRLQEAAEADENKWEEYFGGHTDSRPYGPASVGVDLVFYGSQHLYGLPEHASSFRLKTTKGDKAAYTEPFRLYNLDVFEYELDEPMALYGSIPFVAAHTAQRTAGAFLFNPSETFVDVVSGTAGYETHWLSECGLVDMFLLPGPSPKDVAKQMTTLTGRQALPPIFALGYHQCRWNYKDEKDVAQVHAKFEELDFPYDVLWLDIEHTDGKRYFTWDKSLFPDPVAMQESLAAQGRKMVTIIDPHIKRDEAWPLHQEATEKGLYVKDKDGKDFDGFCWPGQSSYLDFTSPEVRKWWAERFKFDSYEGSTKTLFTWNDMNEPSVFNGPEVSMQKDCRNLAGQEHREWHNLYGYYMQWATAEGHKVRSGNSQRPFVLTRSFWAGSQRWGAMWTGDNRASWDHLAMAAPMLLSISLAGLSFAGADVGGFFQDTDAELMTRWMQAGAFQPFFRGHAHHDTKRKEPWVYGEPTTSRIRAAVVARYTLLPYWYTLFAQAYRQGIPVMRPLLMEYPSEKPTFDIDDQWLVGSDLLVKPVTAAGVNEVTMYFPGTQPWYDIETHERIRGPQSKKVAAPIDKIPVFQRGGSVVPRKMRVRRSTAMMRKDPYTLVVALDQENKAEGFLYIDDEVTPKHDLGQDFVYTKVAAAGGTIHSERQKGGIKAKSKPWTRFDQKVERIVVVGFGAKPSAISVSGESSDKPRNLDFDYDGKKKVLTIRKPDVFAAEEWIITMR